MARVSLRPEAFRKASMTDAPQTPKTAASFRALLPLVRYGSRYTGRAHGGAGGAPVSSAATLAVPFALRRMIDFGFSKESGGAIDAYFLAMGAVVIVIALAAATRYYLVDDARRAGRRRPPARRLRPSDRARRRLLRSGAHRRTRVAPDRRHDPDQGRVRRVGLDRAAQSLHVRRRDRADGLHEPEALGAGAGRHSGDRRAADRLGADRAPPLPPRPGHAGRRDRLRLREPRRRCATMQAFGAEARAPSRFARAVESAYAAARDAAATRAILIAVAVSLAFCSVVVVLWLGAHDVLAGRMSGGLLSQFVLFAVLAATSLGELSQVWSEAAAAAGAAGRISELLAVEPRIVAPNSARRDAAAARARSPSSGVSFAYDARAGRPGDRRSEFLDRAGRAGRARRRLRRRQVDDLPAASCASTTAEAGRCWSTGSTSKAVDPRTLRARIAPVPQDPSIFGGSVSENIAYGAPTRASRRSRRRRAARRPTVSSASCPRATRPNSASAA